MNTIIAAIGAMLPHKDTQPGTECAAATGGEIAIFVNNRDEFGSIPSYYIDSSVTNIDL